MTLDSPHAHRISVAPLILSSDDPSFIGRLQKSGAWAMVERLGTELGADRISDDLISDVAGNPMKMDEYALFSRPCVFLVFFDEHARMKLMLGKEYRLLQCHVAALPVYCYLPSMGNVPFKIKLEEVHGLNSGRPFNIMCLADNWEAVLPEMLQHLKELTEQGAEFLTGLIQSAQANVFTQNGNLFRLPYLRIFRENYSISIFYACLEYVLMLLHALVLMDASILTASSTGGKDRQGFEKSLYVSKNELVDGNIYKMLQDSQRILGESSSAHDLFEMHVPSNVIEGMNKLFDTLDHGFRLKRRTWMGFMEACLVLRNVTKGHGVTYYIQPESIRALLEGMVELTSAVGRTSWKFVSSEGKTKRLGTPCFVYYSTVEDFARKRMASRKLHLCMGNPERMYSLYPNILYHPVYDFFFFAGKSSDDTKWYYKNYATGMYLAFPSPWRSREKGLWSK